MKKSHVLWFWMIGCTLPNPAFDITTTGSGENTEDVGRTTGTSGGTSGSGTSGSGTSGTAETASSSAATSFDTNGTSEAVTGSGFDPCQDHLVLDDGPRNVKNLAVGELCDDEMELRWYRIMGDAGTRLATMRPRTPVVAASSWRGRSRRRCQPFRGRRLQVRFAGRTTAASERQFPFNSVQAASLYFFFHQLKPSMHPVRVGTAPKTDGVTARRRLRAACGASPPAAWRTSW